MQVSKSPRGSFVDNGVSRSPRGSIGEQVSKSPRGSFVEQEVSRSPRGSIPSLSQKSPRGSFAEQEASRSPRGSTAGEVASRKSSTFRDSHENLETDLPEEDRYQDHVSHDQRDSISHEDPGFSLTASLTSFIRRLSGGTIVTDIISNTDNSLQEIDTSHTNGKVHHETPSKENLPLETMTANIDTLEVQPTRDTEPPKKAVQE